MKKEGIIRQIWEQKKLPNCGKLPQRRVQEYCKNTQDPRITQDRKGSPYHIPKDYPNPFNQN